MKNQKGFGLVGFLVLLPFLMSIVASIAAAAIVFKANAHLKHECRVSILNSQRSAAEKLRELIKLNPEAQALRERRRSAEAEVEAAQMIGEGVAIGLAQAHLAIVKLAQAKLAIQQKALIAQGKYHSYSAPLKARGAVIRGLSEEAFAIRVIVPSTRSSSRMGRFTLRASPEGDPTPDYHPSDTFTKDQVVDLDVTIDAGSLLPTWLRDLLPNGKLEISSHCQATIEKQENVWTETLNAVR